MKTLINKSCSRLMIALAIWSPLLAHGEDWPRWRGPRGDGSWQAPPLPKEWPQGGLNKLWSQPVGGGYAGVIAVGDSVFTMDRQGDPKEVERVISLNAQDGSRRWVQEYAVEYGDLDYGNGPRAAPTYHQGRIYTLGAVGHVCCFNAVDGKLIWTHDTVKDFKARLPMWGFAASPLVYQDLVIVHVGAVPNASLMALDAESGQTRWRALQDEAGYAMPILIEVDGQHQLVCWTAEGIHGVLPENGTVLWSQPYKSTYGVAIATPIFREGMLLVSGYWEGTMAIRIGPQRGDVKIVWEENRQLRGLMSQPLYREGQVFMIDKKFGLTGFQMSTGSKRWDAENQMTPKGRNPQASMVWLGDSDRAIILNSSGELLLARLTPDGYVEESRTKIIEKTWAHPAYAGTCIYARSDTEIVAYSLVD